MYAPGNKDERGCILFSMRSRLKSPLPPSLDQSASAGSDVFLRIQFESAGGKVKSLWGDRWGGGPAVPRSGGARDHPGSTAHSFPGLAGKRWGEPETWVSQGQVFLKF